MIAECADKLVHLGEKLFNETEMKYRAGNKVRIKSLDWYNKNKGMNGLVGLFTPCMKKLCGKVVTLDSAYNGKYTAIEEDAKGYYLDDSMIEGLAEEEIDLIPKFGEYSDNKPLDVPTMTTDFVKEHGLPCPDVYEFKDENGNVIEAKKIVLEKKKPKYPTTFNECANIMRIQCKWRMVNVKANNLTARVDSYELPLAEKMDRFMDLIICRDAYWLTAGREMGLEGMWKPDWDNLSTNHEFIKINKGCFTYSSRVLVFPTAEMRDAFYENFKDLIEECKELL